MFLLPFSTRPDVFDIFIILEQDSLERIQKADPAIVNPMPIFQKFPPSCRLGEIYIAYLPPARKEEFIQLASCKPTVLEALRLVCAGFEFRPDLGDHDFGPVSMLKGDGEIVQ